MYFTVTEIQDITSYGTDSGVSVVILWRETIAHKESPFIPLGDHFTCQTWGSNPCSISERPDNSPLSQPAAGS